MELIVARPMPVPSEPVGIHEYIEVASTRDTEFLDITDSLEMLVARAGIGVGYLNVQVLHTTTSLVVNEAEPLLFRDFARTLDGVAPLKASYEHDRFERRTVNLTPGERVNGHAHCRALVLNSSVCLNIADSRLVKGRWQRVFMVELDGPQTRTLSAVLVGRPAAAAAVRRRTSQTESRFREALGPSTSLGTGR